jgi:hypothetical protein
MLGDICAKKPCKCVEPLSVAWGFHTVAFCFAHLTCFARNNSDPGDVGTTSGQRRVSLFPNCSKTVGGLFGLSLAMEQLTVIRSWQCQSVHSGTTGPLGTLRVGPLAANPCRPKPLTGAVLKIAISACHWCPEVNWCIPLACAVPVGGSGRGKTYVACERGLRKGCQFGRPGAGCTWC